MMLYVEFLNAFGRNTADVSSGQAEETPAEEKSSHHLQSTELSDVRLDVEPALSHSKHHGQSSKGASSSRIDSDFSDNDGSDTDDEDVSMFYSVIEKPISPTSSMAELPQVRILYQLLQISSLFWRQFAHHFVSQEIMEAVLFFCR